VELIDVRTLCKGKKPEQTTTTPEKLVSPSNVSLDVFSFSVSIQHLLCAVQKKCSLSSTFLIIFLGKKQQMLFAPFAR
jgi:hypothetical protein